MICQKCCKDFPEDSWKKGVTYKAIDEHHSPPSFMMENWEGDLINLCRDCHREIHDIILEIMFKHSNLFKPKKSEYWTWIAIMPGDREDIINEVIKKTKEWLDVNP